MNRGKKVVFIDRDGVINQYPGQQRYVCHERDFKLIPGSIKGMKKLYEKDFTLIVISNQAGVAKGLYTQLDLDKMNKKLLRELRKNGIQLAGIYYCTHHPDDNCECRKPKTGLLTQALKEVNIKPTISFFIGDSFKDMQAALSFGAKPVLVLSGRERISNRPNWEFQPDYIFDNLLLAAHYLCAHYG